MQVKFKFAGSAPRPWFDGKPLYKKRDLVAALQAASPQGPGCRPKAAVTAHAAAAAAAGCGAPAAPLAGPGVEARAVAALQGLKADELLAMYNQASKNGLAAVDQAAPCPHPALVL